MQPLADRKDRVPYLGQQWGWDKATPTKEVDTSAFSGSYRSAS